MNRPATVLWGAASLLLGVSGHFHGDELYLDGLDTDRIEAPLRAPETVRVPIPARNLTVIIIDGLRYDVGAQDDVIAAFERQGVLRPMLAEYPSFTYAGIAAMATGVPGRYSGVRMNVEAPRARLDSLAAQAKLRGICTSIDDGGFEPLRGLLFLPEGAESIDGRRRLEWIYIGGVDAAGHRYGAASPEYRQAVSAATRRVAAVLETRHAEDAVVVVSEHGHLDVGGHGGTEPESLQGIFAAIGPPFRPQGELTPATLRQFAATIAAAIGIDPPQQAVGGAMLDAFGLTGEPRQSTAELDRFDERRLAAAQHRTIIISLILLAGVVGLGVGRARGAVDLQLRDFLPATIYTVVFAVPYPLLGYGWSWSVPRGYAGFVAETFGLAVASTAAAIWIARRDRRGPEAAGFTIVYGIVYIPLSVYAGLDATWLASAFVSWGVILVATVAFYGCVTFGVRALLRPKRSQ